MAADDPFRSAVSQRMIGDDEQMVNLVAPRCTVRGCGRPLELAARTARCADGHGFDRARAGYWNLLQPQDRRSSTPGDRPETALARRRLVAAGAEAPLVTAIAELSLQALDRRAVREGVPAGSSLALLDVGCGEGSLTAAIADALGRRLEVPPAVHGVDLSAAATALAARARPAGCWVVANADRAIPWPDAVFDLVLSINARLPAAELGRVLASGGVVVVAVPGDDDLAELRAELYGSATPLGAGPGLEDRLGGVLAITARRELRWSVAIDGDPGRRDDLLLASYRGARRRDRERLAHAGDLPTAVTRHQLVSVLAAARAG